ncbi:hypothetical protein SPI_01200 [Niveomyces insectorum RCEF 264]|uniref:Uncharacterized protein n=1 Tax=Niveomyces insectorum RCEF 264 TaxID=1081102 RepID=A0A162L527_9HYPO|nr:hypothetical protein SPI_01200 [Niveomyces insectorum RCEF 264]
MTRVTAPINKLARSLSSHPSVARPAYLANAAVQAHHAGASAAVWSEHHLEREENNRHFTMTHRPTPTPVPSPNRVVPLMQTFNFRSSAAASSLATAATPAAADTTTLDHTVLPSLADASRYEDDTAASLRVPLLPDNFFPNRDRLDGHPPEAPDGPLAQPEIVVVAGDPATVVPASALTEVESIGVDGVELKFAHLPEFGAAPYFGSDGSSTSSGGDGDGSGSHGHDSGASEGGMLRDLWKGLVEDLTQPPPTTKSG